MNQQAAFISNGITFIQSNKVPTKMETEHIKNSEKVENNQETTQKSVNKKDLAKVVNLKNIGMPVSGKPWKKVSMT